MRLTLSLVEIVLCLGACSLAVGCGRDAASYTSRGDALAQEGKYAEASIEYRKALQRDAAHGPAYLGLGLTEMELNRGAEGLGALRRAVDLMPESAEAKARLADVALAVYQADPSNASMHALLVDLSDQLLALDSDSFDGLRIKGDLELFAGRPEAAIPYFERADAARPLDKYLTLPYVEALLKAGRAEEGEGVARRYIEHDPASTEIYDLLYAYYASTGRAPSALAVLELRAEKNPANADARLALAAHYGRTGDRQAMAATVEEIIQNRGHYGDGARKAGMFLMQLQDWDAAARAFELGRADNPDQSSDFLRLLATVRLAQGRQAEGRELVEQALAADPTNSDARFIRANLLLLEGGEEGAREAIGELEALRSVRPTDPAVRSNLGKAYLGAGQPDKAREALTEAARLNPRDREVPLLLAAIALRMNMPAEAQRLADELLTADPENAQAALVRAESLMAQRSLDEARRALDDLNRRFPGARPVALQRGVLAILQGRYADAEGILNSLVETDNPDLVALERLTQLYGAQNQFDRAFALVDAKIRQSPESTELRRLRAATAMRAGRYDLAVEDYEALFRANPRSAAFRTGLGNAHRLNGDLDSALHHCGAAREADARAIDAALCLAIANQQLGRDGEAIGLYREVLGLQPSHDVAANNLAYLLTESGRDLEEATNLVRRVVERQPRYLDAHDTLGWVYLKRGMVDSAVDVFRRLVRESPGNASFQHHLGAALAAQGETAEARGALEAALRNGATGAEEAEIRRLLSTLGG